MAKISQGEVNLSLVILDSKLQYSILIDFIKISYCQSREECGNVIGIVGDIDSTSSSIIQNLLNQSTVHAITVLSPHSLPLASLGFPSVIDMNPLQNYVKALVEFVDLFNWTRVELISDNTLYHQSASHRIEQALSRNPEITVTPTGSDRALENVMGFGSDVIIISTEDRSACSILYSAFQLNLTWPSYGWILLNFDPNACSFNMEGIIVINDASVGVHKGSINLLNSFESIQNAFQHVNDSFHENEILLTHKYSNIIFDSILSVVLADELDFNNATFPGVTGQVNFIDGKRQSTIRIQQILKHTQVEIAVYNPQLDQLIVRTESFVSGDRPRGGTLMLVFADVPVVHITIVSLGYVACNVVVSIVLALFVYCRNEPEVKASSVTLSVFMFIGIYWLLLSLPVTLGEIYVQSLESISEFSDYFLCFCFTMTASISLSIPVILATLLVKMLRVYIIFSHPTSYKKMLSSDKALVLYILLLLSPNIITLVVWIPLDPAVHVTFMIPFKDFILVNRFCFAEHEQIVISWQVAYTCLLLLAVGIVSILSNEIRYKHFKDTKATNAFVYIVFFILFSTFIYFFVLQMVIFNVPAFIYTLYISHAGTAMACLFTLFVPKVYYPTKRYLNRNKVVSKTQMSTDREVTSKSTV